MNSDLFLILHMLGGALIGLVIAKLVNTSLNTYTGRYEFVLFRYWLTVRVCLVRIWIVGTWTRDQSAIHREFAKSMRAMWKFQYSQEEGRWHYDKS